MPVVSEKGGHGCPLSGYGTVSAFNFEYPVCAAIECYSPDEFASLKGERLRRYLSQTYLQNSESDPRQL